MKISELKSLIRETIQNALNENKPATSPTKPGTSPTTKPGKPGTDKPKPRRPLGNPDVKPQPKNEALNEEEILQKIVARFKSKK